MTEHFVLTVQMHDARYHGVPEWPPSPARVFQALVAGVARGSLIAPAFARALVWLEQCPPPVIAVPRAKLGQQVHTWVPNNDADTLGGDLTRLTEIRTKKDVTPRLLEGEARFLYAWPLEETSNEEVHALLEAADHLYQFGRGVDMAWATGEVLNDDALTALLERHGGTVHKPATGIEGALLACPVPGSFESLVKRHAAQSKRLQSEGEGSTRRTFFAQPPKALFATVAYNSPSRRRTYELRQGDELFSSSFTGCASLVEVVRNAAAMKLIGALPSLASTVERELIGRSPEGQPPAPNHERVRIIPLPSIGHAHVGRGIRRVAVEVPVASSLDAEDVHWAFSGLEVELPQGARLSLTSSDDPRMLERYLGVSTRWRTVTPAALSEAAQRRRIDPSRQREEAKSGPERVAEEDRAIRAVRLALRHAGVRAEPARIHVQREPFDRQGSRAEAFAPNTRFAKERLWHVELEFTEPVGGPLVVGDGRFLGLGLFAPISSVPAVHRFVIEAGLRERADPAEVARALRRAVMARVQDVLGAGRRLPSFFSGHEEGSAAKATEERHLAFTVDPHGGRLLIVAPHLLRRDSPTREERGYLVVLQQAVTALSELRAGRAGCLVLRQEPTASEDDWLSQTASEWRSMTPYAVNRYEKSLTSAGSMVQADVLAECGRRGLPRPDVVVQSVHRASGRGLEAMVTLRFAAAVAGPMLLGRTRHLGGGLFAPVRPAASA